MFVSQPPMPEIRWAAVDIMNSPLNFGEEESVYRGSVPAGTTFGELLEEGKNLGWRGRPPKLTYAEAMKR